MKASERLRELAALRAKATTGPWRYYSAPNSNTTEVQALSRPPVASWRGFDDSARSRRAHGHNAAFIAAAGSEDFAALAAEVERLEAVRDAARPLIEELPASSPFWSGLERLRAALAAAEEGKDRT